MIAARGAEWVGAESPRLRYPGGRSRDDSAPPPDAPYAALERMNRFQEPEARRIIRDLALPARSRGLDVGCGIGLWALWLAEAVGRGGHVLGIEPEIEKVEAARERARGAARVQFERGEATAIPLADRSVDWVWYGDVLHHVVDTQAALHECLRVLHPGGRVIVKESQVPAAMFLPGHPELERRIQVAEIRRTLGEGAGRSFQERRQTTPAALRAAGLEPRMRTYVLERRAPLSAAAHDYIQHTVFSRNWGDRLRELLDAEDWRARMRVCDEASAENVLRSPDYYCLYPITVFSARVPGAPRRSRRRRRA